ncbi:hypothetical protein OWV82_015068 [Melia azedarach]|uniref:Uncharacterized protein n=1 Tax=Melia azedarach TaxID=155640 RepID=A0ACC1XQD7_MELAZ|nr:hypothetical protein OWV82_015068 [Melia azedarach]
MFDKYHDAMIRAVKMLGETYDENDPMALLRTSPGGVAGMSKTWWSAVVSDNLGLLIRLVVHVCASTIGQGQNGNYFLTLFVQKQNPDTGRECVCVCVEIWK